MKSKLVARIMLAQYETDAAIDETIGFLHDAGFNSVMIMNCRGHSEPAHYTREQIIERAELMRHAMQRFRAEGFSVSINNLATVGMNLSPPSKHNFGIQPLVDPDGQIFPECFCPLDPKFLEYLDFLFYAWASLGPDEVWIDDDFRYKNKAAQCFCPLHLKKLEEVTRKAWGREELAAELYRSDARPNELSGAWNQIQKDALLGAARQITESVGRADPNIGIGLMGINNCVHHYGSDYFSELLEILNPGGPALIRPEFAAYDDYARLGWSGYWPLWSSLKGTSNFIAYPEYEHWPGTKFNHSYRVLRMKYEWAAVYGFREAAHSTMWDTYHFEPKFASTMNGILQSYERMADIIADPSLVPYGVSLQLSEDRAGTTDILWIDSLAAMLVGRLGIPLWPTGNHATFLTGNSPLANLDRWGELLKGGIVLDRYACDTLIACGRDDHLGGVSNVPMEGIPAFEWFEDDQLNGLAANRMISMETATARRLDMPAFALDDDKNTRVLSWFEDEDGNRLSPGTWLRETPAGRVAVLPFSMYDATSQNAIANWKRKSHIENLLEWVAGKTLPVKISGAADLFCVYRQSREADRILVALANFSNDSAEDFTLTLPLAAKWDEWRARVMTEGEWSDVRDISRTAATFHVKAQFAIAPQSVCLVELRSA